MGNPYYSENRGGADREESASVGERISGAIRGFFGAKPAGPALSEQERRGAARGRSHQRERERQLKEITGDMDRRRKKKPE